MNRQVRCQERVKTRQDRVERPGRAAAGWCGGAMAEDVIALVIGLALIGYLLWALVRPERF